MLRVGLGGLGAVSLGGTVPSFVSKFALGEVRPGTAISNDNILVVVQLSGGNDGLNTVVPVGDDAYFNARPSIGLKNRLHTLDDHFALNPGMGAFKQLFDDGRLAIINGCGYPNPNRSHFKSLEIWHTASLTNCGAAAGWLGRCVDQARRCGAARGSLPAVNLGPELPQALVCDEVMVPSLQSLDDLALPREALADASPAIDYFGRQATNAVIQSDAIRTAAENYIADAAYPGGLGRQLHQIAQLISGNFGTKLFYCQVGGFDTHANQLGQHERLLANVASSIAAFTDDMKVKGFGDKVAVMCFSEFGRRVEQNSSAGTDHGAAGPMFVVGGNVKGGVYGAHPSLSDLDDGDLKYTTDFRRVYATLLDNWLNANSSAILKNTFEPIAFL